MPLPNRTKTAFVKLAVCIGSLLLLLVFLPTWIWSTALAAPLEQGTLPPRHSPTPEPTTVVPTTVVPTTVVPTTVAPTSEPTSPAGGETPAPATSATPVVLLPDSGGASEGDSWILPGVLLVGGALTLFLGRRFKPRTNSFK